MTEQEQRESEAKEPKAMSDESSSAVSLEVILLRAENDRLKEARRHTQQWYAKRYGKLEDWARTILPEPWSSQFFSCITNGLYDSSKDVGESYRCIGGFMITPSNYFQLETAQEQILHDQCVRAEDAEVENKRLRGLLESAK